MSTFVSGLFLSAISAFTPISMYTIDKLHVRESDCQQCAELDIEYPKLLYGGNEQTRAKIQKEIQTNLLQHLSSIVSNEDKILPDLQTVVQTYFADSKSYHQDISDGPAFSLDYNVKVLEYTSSWVSLSQESYMFLGGAHPLSNVNFANYDLQSGKRLTIDDIIKTEARAELVKLAEEAFRAARELDQGQSLADMGFEFKDDKFDLPENMALTKEALIFYFNPYDIAAYVYGPTEVKVYFSQMGDLKKRIKPLYWKALAVN